MATALEPQPLKMFQFTLQTATGEFAPPAQVNPTCNWDGKVQAPSRKQAVLIAQPKLTTAAKRFAGVKKRSRVEKILGRDGKQHYVRRREFVGVFATLPFRCQEVDLDDPTPKRAA